MQRKKCPNADECVAAGLSEKTKQALKDLGYQNATFIEKRVEP